MKRRYDVTLGGALRTIEVEDAGDGAFRVTSEAGTRTLGVTAGVDGLTWMDGVTVTRARIEGEGEKLAVTVGGVSVPVRVGAARAAGAQLKGPAAVTGPLVVRAPIPGRVAKLLVAVGQSVAAGQGLLVLEAMKMENELRAARAGTVQMIHVAEGAAVEAAAELLTVV